MGSEPDEEMLVALPPDLAEWVDEQAAEYDLDPDTVLVQLLAAYRATEHIENGEAPAGAAALGGTDLEDEVYEVVADRIPDIAGATVERLELDARIESEIDQELDARAPEIAELAADRVGDRIEAVRSDFRAKLDDVRERVVQVKRETDRKAPADHDHPDLTDHIEELAARLDEVGTTVEDLRGELDGRIDDHERRLEEVDETVRDAQEKLRTVAYAVTDLRESGALEGEYDASVDRLKRSAAEQDVERARCEVCGEGVAIGLLADPECPHCRATVTGVEPGEGLFGKPKLVRAKSIESGDEPGDGGDA